MLLMAMIAGIGVGSHKPEFTHEDSLKNEVKKDEKDSLTYNQAIPHNQFSQKEAQ